MSACLTLIAGFTAGAPEHPGTCPWRVYDDPLVIDIMTLRRERRAGLVHRRPLSPRLREALAVYDSAYRIAVAERRRKEHEERAPPPQPGTTRLKGR